MLAESEIKHVLDALCGCPTVTTPEFADRIEKILRAASSSEKESDISPCLTGLNAYGEACSNEEYEILARREPTTDELHAIINHLAEKLYPYEHDN